jgi:hypothetical protein
MTPQTWIAIVAALGTFALTIIFYKRHWIWSVGCALLFLLSVVVGVHFQNKQEYEEHGNDAIFQGILVPSSRLGSKALSCMQPRLKGDVELFLGPNLVCLRNLMDTPASLFKAGHSIINIRRVNDELKLQLLLFDSDGMWITFIKDNNFTINPAAIKRMLLPGATRTADGSRLLVFDRENNEVLQIDFFTPAVMTITGTFGDKGKLPIVLRSNRMLVGTEDRSFNTYNLTLPRGYHPTLPLMDIE